MARGLLKGGSRCSAWWSSFSGQAQDWFCSFTGELGTAFFAVRRGGRRQDGRRWSKARAGKDRTGKGQSKVKGRDTGKGIGAGQINPARHFRKVAKQEEALLSGDKKKPARKPAFDQSVCKSGTYRPSTSCMLYRPVLLSPRKRAARRLPLA